MRQFIFLFIVSLVFVLSACGSNSESSYSESPAGDHVIIIQPLEGQPIAVIPPSQDGSLPVVIPIEGPDNDEPGDSSQNDPPSIDEPIPGPKTPKVNFRCKRNTDKKIKCQQLINGVSNEDAS